MRLKRCSSLDLQIKGPENEHFSQKAEKKMDLSYFERKLENFVYVHGHGKKTLTLVKQSPLSPLRPSIVISIVLSEQKLYA